MTEVSSGLESQQCSNLAEPCSALNDDENSDLLLQLQPQWQLDQQQNTISYNYIFKNYYQTMAFVNIIAQIAHQQDHHPELLVSYNRCTVTYSTHSAGGLTMKDFICAAKINAAQDL